MILKFKNSNTRPQNFDENQNERLFYHDLLNQTHGLLLFLSHKSHELKGMTPDEVELMTGELKKVQSLIKNQSLFYNFSNELTSLKQFMNDTQHLIKIFLPEKRFNVLVEVHGLESEKESFMVPTLSWSRIITNIIKNVSEHGAGKTTFSFTFDAHQVTIQTENEIAERNTRITGEGLGLSSTRMLSREIGGKFVCAAVDGCWRNKIVLPYHEEKKAKKSA